MKTLTEARHPWLRRHCGSWWPTITRWCARDCEHYWKRARVGRLWRSGHRPRSH